ncbi:hypothetical protein FS749_011045 [Ceratobasidium sp. UAMH 11750]|nr:hypothetical protein FS749_011045 [Ceratobasidium sp. UAMH 11750]
MRLSIRYIPYALITTLFYASLVLLNITPPPTWLNNQMQRTTQLFRERVLDPYNFLRINRSVVGEPPTWLAQSAASFSRAVSRVGDMHRTLAPSLYGIPIGGAWTEYSVPASGFNLTLPRNIVFPPGAPKHATIPPSPDNGYLNSRIDLRRRKRAFDEPVTDQVAQPVISLHLRDDAMFQPRNIDPAVLVSQLHEAIRRNQEIEREKAARRLRKARKKKKKGSSAKKGA